jgi:hypothetical protein
LKFYDGSLMMRGFRDLGGDIDALLKVHKL